MDNFRKSIVEELYGLKPASEVCDAIDRMIQWTRRQIRNGMHGAVWSTEQRFSLDHDDLFIITYGDQFQESDGSPLSCLGRFAEIYLKGIATGIHILPFFPYSSDDGFSVVDYCQVDPALGTWADIGKLTDRFIVMADLVINHCSSEHRWFRQFLKGDPRYEQYFIEVPEGTDVSSVVRPRTHPLLTEFERQGKCIRVWTTFSADQIDLNFHNPHVLLEMVRILLLYLRMGIRVIRLDAIAFLWKEAGTSCLHHRKTHLVVKLIRSVLEETVPGAVLITETNVPHADNISYFGSGRDEAHMVYQFALPPLVLHSFVQEDAGRLATWAASLEAPPEGATFFNFLASHDGIGLLPVHGILSEEEIAYLVETVVSRGGRISYKASPKGEVPYEMNINYCDAVAEQALPMESRIRKFLTSQAIMLAMPGIPAVYIHSLIGSGNWIDGVAKTGKNRAINREKLSYAAVSRELDTPGTFRNLVYTGYRQLLLARKEYCFHPLGEYRVIGRDKQVFALLRVAPDESESMLCMHNIGSSKRRFTCSFDSRTGFWRPDRFDSITGKRCEAVQGTQEWKIDLAPWETLWLRCKKHKNP